MDSASAIVDLLQTFQIATGQEINVGKSSIFFSSNLDLTFRRSIVSVLHIQEADGESS